MKQIIYVLIMMSFLTSCNTTEPEPETTKLEHYSESPKFKNARVDSTYYLGNDSLWEVRVLRW